jgi:hypothetical protein
MRRILHIITKPNDVLPELIIAEQASNAKNKVEIVDLTSGEPNYKELLGKIFEADSVECW